MNKKNNYDIEKWSIFELWLNGPEEGNPFVEVKLKARFSSENSMLEVEGFYDGDGKYCIRFMPDTLGVWSYITESNISDLDNKVGKFTCIEPSANNHGTVKVYDTYHFCYSDKTPFYPFGTTCYGWTNQSSELEEQTLATLKASPFNKIRMCVLPKPGSYTNEAAVIFPFEGNPSEGWNFKKLNPDFFRKLEERTLDLLNLGIEADLILFHPYDKGYWGFDQMGAEADDFYLNYMLARFSAYRNVWWSIANEFDFIMQKSMEDWDRFKDIIVAKDPYRHLTSIHNGTVLYDNCKSGITHASIQNGSAVADFGRAVLFRDVYKKPVIYDEVCYEGDYERRWGQLSGEELTHRFWQGIIAGTYVSHAEIFKHPQDISWLSRGGVLLGESPARIGFLRKIVEEAPIDVFNPVDKWWNEKACGKAGEYYLFYFGKELITEWKFELPGFKVDISEGTEFKVDIIDTWEMSITSVLEPYFIERKGTYFYGSKDNKTVKLPGKPYMALRIYKG